ncbi:MAG: FAD-dependent oxidoreductase [Acetatifactor sp.]|nr:FAD-dependent oxidoreductase [Acetatifactor sp.]
MHSLWQEIKLPEFPQLREDIHTDVLIIGGGIAGILTAYLLHQKGVKYLLIEKERICSWTTQNTTAKITAQHGLNYHKILKSGGVEKVQKYLQANQAALEKYAELCADIDCDYELRDNYVYATQDRKKLEEELEALHRIGFPAEFCESLPLPLETVGAVKFPMQAQFHPLKFLAAISEGLHLYEHTFAREMIGKTVVTDHCRIYADQVITATHFPFINKHGLYFLKMYQHRSYVIALKNAQDVGGMYVDENHIGVSFRNSGDLLLLGGGGHRTGQKGGDWRVLRSFAGEHYPDAEEKYFWAAQDCMTLDDIPYIGQYSKNTPGFYVAAGFNKWGMTGAMVSAMLLTDAVLGRQNELAEVFNPSRSMLKPQLLLNSFEAVKGLLTFTGKRCPHLGCALKWNPAEHSWDCSCHGSRFSERGELLDNPANGNLK